MPYVYSNPDELTCPRFAEVFAAGCGGTVIDDVATPWQGGAWCGFGSPATWHSLTEARLNGAVWYYGDHGYFSRGNYYRITKDAFQYNGPMRPDFERLWRTSARPQPWKTDGAAVLVCPPDEAIATLMGFDQNAWFADVAMRLRNNTDRPVIVRDRRADRPLREDLKNAWALVTWTSNAAVDALVAGVPVFCTGDCAASPMGRQDPINIEYPAYPDNRDEWAATLAANQWTFNEMSSGKAWSELNGQG
jgi:hypothetical protein